MLPNIYDLQIWEEKASLTVASIDCSVVSTKCNFPDRIAATLNVDLTGLPAHVVITLSSGIHALRRLKHVGGVHNQLQVLALSSFTVGVSESFFDSSQKSGGIARYTVFDITSEFVLDLTDLPANVYISLFEKSIYGRWILRSLLNQGGAVQRYTVLCASMYEIDVFSNNTLVRFYNTKACACGGTCEVTSVTI